MTGDERYLMAGIAETDGANQTKWKSNLALLNLSGSGRYGRSDLSPQWWTPRPPR